MSWENVRDINKTRQTQKILGDTICLVNMNIAM